MLKLSAKWAPKCLNADQKRQRCQSSEQVLDFFFVAIEMISCHDWRTWTKPGYISMTQRKNNNQWSGGIAAHPAPKKFRVQKSAGNFSPQFFGIKTASSSLIIFQRSKLSTRSITHLCWCNWRTFCRKNAADREGHQGGSCSCTTMSLLTGHLQPRRNLPTCASSVLITPPFSGSGPFGLPRVTRTEVTIERSPFFVRRGGHFRRGDLAGRTTSWIFFWVACKS